MLTDKQFRDERLVRCLDEMYQASQPPISWKELLEKQKQHPTEQIFNQHYLSQEESNYIIDKYIDLYNLKDPFKDYCDLLIRDLDGCNKSIYVEGDGNKPGYRSYEKVPSLAESIGKENLQKVKNFIEMRKYFYRFNGAAENFRFNIWNMAPCTNKEIVINYYLSKGTPINITETPKEYFYEKYYLGASEEEIKELMEEHE